MSKDEGKVTDQTQTAVLKPEGPALPPVVQDEIGRRLRAVYGRMAEEPLPDKFQKLLEELAKADNGEVRK